MCYYFGYFYSESIIVENYNWSQFLPGVILNFSNISSAQNVFMIIIIIMIIIILY